jgi:hypothetical protein
MDVFRRMMRISRRNRIKNEEIKIRIGVDIIIKDIEEKQFI